MTQYTEGFYDGIRTGAALSARTVVDYLYPKLKPQTVVDIGCGEGHWAKAFKDRGAEVIGVDGSYVQNPVVDFIAADLAKATPLGELGNYDLAISLEVAEHLPARRAKSFADDLCSLAPNILFSAAPPGQPGTHHVNCQWFDDYWMPMFEEHGYEASGILRLMFWDNPNVEWWYQQNMILLSQTPSDLPDLFRDPMTTYPHKIVHPTLYESKI